MKTGHIILGLIAFLLFIPPIIFADEAKKAYDLSDLLKIVDEHKNTFYSDTDNIKSAQRL